MAFRGRVIVYSIVGCPHCKAAKSSLKEKSVPFVEVSIDKFQSSVREQVKALTTKSTVPQIFFNDRYVGGNTELQALMKDTEKWEEMVTYVRETEVPDGSPVPPTDDLALAEDEPPSDEAFKCEPDENYKILLQFDEAGFIGDNRSGLFNKKRTFRGDKLLEFLQDKLELDKDTAASRAQMLLDEHFIQALDKDEKYKGGSKLYRMLADDDSSALNAGDASECVVKTVDELGEDLRKLILKLYNEFLSADGKKVDYAGIAKSDSFKTYQKMTLQLQRVKIESASRDEKLAFFINIYNALVIHAYVAQGPPTNMWQRYKFFNYTKYIIGGLSYSLQDMENGVLRANRKGVGMLFVPFGKSDPRLSIALTEHEPFIHFALVCGAKSCPPIKTYSSKNIMQQLKLAAQSFMEGDDVQVDLEKKVVRVSKIFSWYKSDFGGNNTTLVNWIIENLDDGEKKENLKKLVQEPKYKVDFLNYDWGVNS